MTTTEQRMNLSRPPLSPTAIATIAIALSLWALAVCWASISGTLARLYMPLYAVLVAIGIALPTAAYFASPFVSRLIQEVGLYRLTLFHAWRIPAALLFFYFGAAGFLPPTFWILAGVGDLLAGVYALTLLIRPVTQERLWRIHAFGFADFVVAVGTGLTFTLMQDVRMALLSTLPMALIPLFGVGISGASHLIAFRMLAKSQVQAD